MREYFGKVAKIKKDKKFEKIYDIVEKVMIERKDIHPNVDYPTGPTYHLMGFDTDFFTPAPFLLFLELLVGLHILWSNMQLVIN